MRLPGGRVELCQRATRLLGHLEQDVAGRTGVEHRLHDWLHQAPHARARREVVPPLERVMLRQQQVAEHGRLVEVERRRDFERHLFELLGEAGCLGKRVCGVGVVHEEDRHLPSVDGRGELGQRAVAVAALEVGAELDRLADVPADEVEQSDRRAQLGGALVLRGGSDSEMVSGFGREETRVIADAPGIARNAQGPLSSSELFVIINLPKRSTGTDAR